MSRSIQDQTSFYDQYWRQLKPFGSYKIQRVTKLLTYLHVVRKHFSDFRILDLGCGDGRCVAIWNEIAETSGLDLSVEAMEVASKRYPFLSFQSGDARKTSFKDGEFDVIISQEVIEHIEDQALYINECNRLLSSRGFLILTTPNKYYFDRVKGGNYSNQPVENIISAKALKELIKENFEILILESAIIAKGDYGIYRFLSNGYLVGAMNRLGVGFIRQKLMEKFRLGVHLCLVARKRN